ncbi:MAG: hypothetical protein ABID35_07285 [Candidatus Margulisiibacteriota bacterium]
MTGIARARDNLDYLKVSELRSVKNQAIDRVKVLKEKIWEEDGWIRIYEVK